MVIKPIEFAMIQQQNNVSKSQHNIETRSMTEQQAITQQVEKNTQHNSRQVNKKDNADNENAHYDAKDKSNNEYNNEREHSHKKKDDGRVIIKGQGSADFDVKI